jgi:phosphatidylglycerophosphate synthase
MVVGGMTVVERVLREAAKAGAERAVVYGDLPVLPELPLEVVRADGVPDGEVIAGDTIAGVTITDEKSRRAASAALWKTCRRPHDGLGDRYVIRAISTRLSRVLCKLNWTPNQVTLANIVIGLAACAVAATGAFVLAGALMFAQVVLDSCDGELARVRFMHSRLGMILDNGSDDLIDNLFVAMLGVGIGGIWAPIGIAAAIARGISALMIHIDVAKRGKLGDVLAFKWFFDKDESLVDRFDTGTSLFGVGRAFGRRDLYVLVWAATCVVGVPIVGLCLSIVLSAAYFGLSVAHVILTRRS